MIRVTLLVFVLSLWLGCAVDRTRSAAAGKTNAEACAACHGAAGISDNPLIPNLAGQRAPYFVNTLRAFENGTRKSPVMGPIAAGLNRAEMENLAAYFSGLPPMTSKGDPKFSTQGKVSYFFCQECHGPFGAGNEANPRLAGQHADYELEQLKAYKRGTRTHPVMSGIAGALSEQDMQAVVEYLAALK